MKRKGIMEEQPQDVSNVDSSANYDSLINQYNSLLSLLHLLIFSINSNRFSAFTDQ